MTDTPVIKKKGGRPKGSTNSPNSRPKTAKAKLREYEKLLPKITLNDYEQLKTLVAIEDELDALRNKLKTITDANDKRKLSEAITNYSKEYRLILVSLGIERSQRSFEIDMQQSVDDFVGSATKLIEDSGRKITCTHCESDFEMGYVLFHFRDDVGWRFDFDCPKCGRRNRISGIKTFLDEHAN